MTVGIQNRKGAAIEKRHIFFTRDYRHLPRPRMTMWLFVVLLIVPTIVGLVLFYPQISYGISVWTSGVITNGTGIQTAVTSAEFIPAIGPVYLVDIAGSLPTFLFSVINLIVSAAILLAVALLRRSGMRSFAIYVSMAMFVHMISSLFFIFFPEYFPYALVDYSELYMEQQIAIWICIAGISGFAIALIFSPFLSKLLSFVATLVYTGIYGITRYVLYLLILHYFSSLYMATLFFTLGVLFDFLQMVFIYIIYIRYASMKYGSQKEGTLWKWS
ncbi:MAG: hypothetical protein ABIG45_04620 [Bacillota bacterium]